MASVFTMIINGELPGRFVWEDDECVAFLTINPLTKGHTLVVPREEIDEWTDLSADLWNHLTDVAHRIGEAIKHAFGNSRVGLIVAGFEVAHAHVHVFGADTMSQFDFSRADPDPDPAELDDAAVRIRTALQSHGYAGNVPG